MNKNIVRIILAQTFKDGQKRNDRSLTFCILNLISKTHHSLILETTGLFQFPVKGLFPRYAEDIISIKLPSTKQFFQNRF